MSKGDPHCPKCRGAGGAMLRRVGQQPRWVLCRTCKPNTANHEMSRIQTWGAVHHSLSAYACEPERKLPNLTMAIEAAAHFYTKEELHDKLDTLIQHGNWKHDILDKLYPTTTQE